MHNTVVMTRPNSTFVRAADGTASLRLQANLLASTGDTELVTGLESGRVMLASNVHASANQVPGSDQVLSPGFWPVDDLLMSLLLPASVDSSYRQDSPAPLRLRAQAEPARLVGALQARP